MGYLWYAKSALGILTCVVSVHLRWESPPWLQMMNITIIFLKNLTLLESSFPFTHYYFGQREEKRNSLTLSPIALNVFTLPLHVNDLVKNKDKGRTRKRRIFSNMAYISRILSCECHQLCLILKLYQSCLFVVSLTGHSTHLCVCPFVNIFKYYSRANIKGWLCWDMESIHF